MSSQGPNHTQLLELPVGRFSTVCKVSPVGSLQARPRSNGAVAFYWRYSLGSKSERVPIGIYDPRSPRKSLSPTSSGYSYAAALRAAETLAIEHYHHLPHGGRPALESARRDAQILKEEESRAAKQHTLANLLDDYCDHLEALGRRSHKDARSIFRLHVVGPWEHIAGAPAKKLTTEQFADMMRRLIEGKKGRTANKLRSYARSAFQFAKAARSKPSIPLRFKSYGITVNPIAETEPDESQNRPDKRPLTTSQLRLYWSLIQRSSGFKAALLRLHLLTGGQRIEQLVNLRTKDILRDSFVLFDGKGRPGSSPRPHVVPLTDRAAEALAACGPTGEFALSTDGGVTHVAATTLAQWACECAAAIDGFQAKRVRSGVETLLAAQGVSSEIRGRLQSHGISGVQARHYDGHDYLLEKLNALTALERTLTKAY